VRQWLRKPPQVPMCMCKTRQRRSRNEYVSYFDVNVDTAWRAAQNPCTRCSPAKRYESVAINWRTGDHERVTGLKRNADIFWHVVERCVTRSAKRKRRVILIPDGPRFHKPEGSRKVRALLERHSEHLSIVYIPTYDPDSNPTELHWRH
jgi:DDE superfamily endonuclease